MGVYGEWGGGGEGVLQKTPTRAFVQKGNSYRVPNPKDRLQRHAISVHTRPPHATNLSTYSLFMSACLSDAEFPSFLHPVTQVFVRSPHPPVVDSFTHSLSLSEYGCVSLCPDLASSAPFPSICDIVSDKHPCRADGKPKMPARTANHLALATGKPHAFANTAPFAVLFLAVFFSCRTMPASQPACLPCHACPALPCPAELASLCPPIARFGHSPTLPLPLPPGVGPFQIDVVSRPLSLSLLLITRQPGKGPKRSATSSRPSGSIQCRSFAHSVWTGGTVAQ